MKNLIIFLVGGSNRIGKILVHLIAAKTLRGVKSIRFIFVDSDSGNGDKQDVVDAINTLTQNLSALGLNIDVITETWAYQDVLNKCLYRLNENSPRTLKAQFVSNVVDTALVMSEKNDNDILIKSQFSFSQAEEKDTREGFYGCNNVGATFIKCASMHDNYAAEHSPLVFLNNVITNQAEEYKIIIVGSTFGGTASAFMLNLSKEIKDYVAPLQNGYRIKFAGLFLLPYFRYEWTGESKSPNPNEFPEASYYTLRNMRAFAGDYSNLYSNNGGMFDKIYLVGNEKMEYTDIQYNPEGGGSKQRNNMTVTDYIAASAVVDFSNSDVYEQTPYYYDLGSNGSDRDPDTQRHETKTVNLSMLKYGNEMYKYGQFCLLVAFQHAHNNWITENKDRAGFVNRHPVFSKLDVSTTIFGKVREPEFVTESIAKSDNLFKFAKDYVIRINEINNGKNSNDNTINQLLFTPDASRNMAEIMKKISRAKTSKELDDVIGVFLTDLYLNTEPYKFDSDLTLIKFKYNNSQETRDIRFEDFFTKLFESL